MERRDAGLIDLLDRLGGGRASVHRAIDRASGRVVVVKRAGWADPVTAAGLGREAEVLRRVSHPSLPRLRSVVEDDAGRALVMAHLPGGTLTQRLAEGPISPSEIAELGAALASALAALHEAGAVHRDLHPDNVLFDAELTPVLIDLDHALLLDATPVPADDDVVGHPDFIDPRVRAGAPADARADLHSLGLLLRFAARAGHDAAPDAPLPASVRAVVDECVEGTTSGAADVAARLRVAAVEAAVRPERAAAVGATSPAPGPSPLGPSAVPPPTLASGERPSLTEHGATTAGRGPVATVGYVTRRWGPAPPRHSRVAAVAEPARRAGWVVAAAAALVLPVLAVVGLRGGGPASPAAREGEPVAAPAPCDGVVVGPTVTLADLSGRGCGQPLTLHDGVLSTPVGDFRLGEPGDVLVAGDWDDDGVWSPGLYRPATGEVYLFDGQLDGGRSLRSRAALQRRAGGVPVVVTGAAGHDVQVVPATT